MELHIDPVFAIKNTKFKKKRIPWNKGKKGWLSDRHKKSALENLKKGAGALTRQGKKPANAIHISAYTLSGTYIKTYRSSGDAAKELGCDASKIRRCIAIKRKSTGGYMFRKAEIIEFKGEKFVSKKSIEPYERKKTYTKKQKTL